MIKYESELLEKAVISGQSCIAVPIDVFLSSTGELTVTTYRATDSEAQDFSEQFASEPLSTEAENWINNAFSAFAEKYGYEHMEGENSRMLEYFADDIRQLTKPSMYGKCIKIDSNNILKMLCDNTGCDIEIDGGDDVIFAIIEDGQIASYAGVNDVFYKGKALEINVETAEYARNKGYGCAVVYALCEFLLERGYKVLYKCAKSNKASAGLAEKCGLALLGERYSYVCYSK